MNAVYLKGKIIKIFLKCLYIAYISSFPPANDSESIQKKHEKMSKKVEFDKV